MPTPPTSHDELLEALNLVEQYGSAHNAVRVSATPLPEATVRHRAERARLVGLTPTYRKDAPRIYTRERLGRMHIVIPDVQAKPGVPLEHLEWVGRYIAEKRPDVVIQIGDFADMEALSKYDVGTLRGENKRLKKDLQVARKAMDRLVGQWSGIADYRPAMHLTMGNHEDRLDRFANEHPYLEEVVGTHMLNYEEWGWKVHPFLNVVTVDGIDYSHFFVSGEMGRPVASARALMNRRKARSAVMGHVQRTDCAFDPVTHQWFMFCGVCYLHDEGYLNQQSNLHRRQILVLHEVEDGRCDPMWVSLNFLKKAYG